MLHLSRLDQLIINFDQGLRTLFGQPLVTVRTNPADTQEDSELTATEKQLVARLMRVNHAGEVSAQALYQGQSLLARTETVHHRLQQSAREENDHLYWCTQRLDELGGHRSLLNPFWYIGSFTIGTLAAIPGDQWSLGFMAETERQVVKHLDQHLHRLPAQDQKSRAILEQMKQDEAYHATAALKVGGVNLPKPINWLMIKVSKLMTTTAFLI